MGNSTKKSKSSKKDSSSPRFYEDKNGFLIPTKEERERREKESQERCKRIASNLIKDRKKGNLTPEEFVQKIFVSKNIATAFAEIVAKDKESIQNLKKYVPDTDLRDQLCDQLIDYTNRPSFIRALFVVRFGFFPGIDAKKSKKYIVGNTEVDLSSGSYKDIYHALTKLPHSELSRLKPRSSKDSRSDNVTYAATEKSTNVSAKEMTNGQLIISVDGVTGKKQAAKDEFRGSYQRREVEASKNLQGDILKEVAKSQAAKWALSSSYWSVSGWEEHKKSDMMRVMSEEFGNEFGGNGRAGSALPLQATLRVSEKEEDIDKPIHVWMSDVANSLDERSQSYVFGGNVKKNRHDYLENAIESNWMKTVYNAGSKAKYKEPNSRKNFFRQEKNKSVWYSNLRTQCIGNFTNPVEEFITAYVLYCENDERLSAKGKTWFKNNLGERGKM